MVFQLKVLHFTEITSTNDYAKNIVANKDSSDADEDIAILADIQTAGRGRLSGRLWVSVFGNFHCSYIIGLGKLGISEVEVSLVTNIAIGVIKNWLVDLSGNEDGISVKLPNDVLIRNKKVAGVLTEIQYPYAIVGVGINLICSPLDTAANIRDEMKVLVRSTELVDNLYTRLLNGMTGGF
ncbi:MAG: biotin--[acetyl-CoA-carboxylase] ligase [Holosporales bacterium]|nr:biotin--[acetyl-CoA-carboxylase] ligase [Holosporales bacterium]